MELGTREFWALIHGIVLGGAFLLAFSGGLAGLYSLRSELVTPEGIRERMRRLTIGTTAMAGLLWLTVIVGTWVVYPWSREDIPSSPKSKLLATAAAFVVLYYRSDLVRNQFARRLAMGLLIAAFAAAVVAGVLGALITKEAPVT